MTVTDVSIFWAQTIKKILYYKSTFTEHFLYNQARFYGTQDIRVL